MSPDSPRSVYTTSSYLWSRFCRRRKKCTHLPSCTQSSDQTEARNSVWGELRYSGVVFHQTNRFDFTVDLVCEIWCFNIWQFRLDRAPCLSKIEIPTIKVDSLFFWAQGISGHFPAYRTSYKLLQDLRIDVPYVRCLNTCPTIPSSDGFHVNSENCLLKERVKGCFHSTSKCESCILHYGSLFKSKHII